MANADYTARNLGLPFCPSARLAAPIGALDTTATMTGYTSPIAEGIRIGMAAMVGGEIVVVEARSGNTLTLGRGTCDTIPAPHAANTPIFFFDDSVGSDDRQYVATESIGVKPLPRTTSGGPVSIEASPPVGLTFNWRFNRPYPPGNVRVNGQPFTSVVSLGLSTGPLTLTWAHRDRIVQMDQLVKHGEASIGPEAGTTYRVRVIRASDGSVRRTADLGAVTAWSYSFAEFVADFGPSASSIPAFLTLESRRDGLSSWQSYSIAFVGLSSIASDSDTLDVGYPVAAGGFATLDVGYPVAASGFATLDVGYEVGAGTSEVTVVRSLFDGTNGQTTGIGNTGTSGGNWTGAQLSDTYVFAGPTSLLVNGVSGTIGRHTPAVSVEKAAGQAVTWEARMRFQQSASWVGNAFFALKFSGSREIGFFLEGYGSTSVIFAALPGTGFSYDIAGRTMLHVCISIDAATNTLRSFVNGSQVGIITGYTEFNSAATYLETAIETSIDCPFYIDNFRLRYGFAYTASFTPDSTI